MLKSCQYCGKIHDAKYICEQKAAAIKRRQNSKSNHNMDTVRFRRTNKWRRKSEEIRKRDKYCCQVCIRNLYDIGGRVGIDSVSVHHIIPVAKDDEKALDNTNLITVCDQHHEMAESGVIPADELIRLAQEQEGAEDEK